jgi:hypothetical protein
MLREGGGQLGPVVGRWVVQWIWSGARMQVMTSWWCVVDACVHYDLN